MKKLKIKQCVSEMLDALCDRKGMDDWYNNLDDDITAEIETELEEILQEYINKSNEEPKTNIPT